MTPPARSRREQSRQDGQSHDTAPGLRPVLGTLEAALRSLDEAKRVADQARADILDLVVRAPDGDWLLDDFLHALLTGPSSRLSDAVEGLADEQRQLRRLTEELALIDAKARLDLVRAFDQIAALTGDHRSVPIVRPAAGIERVGVPVAEPAGGLPGVSAARTGQSETGRASASVHETSQPATSILTGVRARLGQLMQARGTQGAASDSQEADARVQAGRETARESGGEIASSRDPARHLPERRAHAVFPGDRLGPDDGPAGAAPGGAATTATPVNAEDEGPRDHHPAPAEPGRGSNPVEGLAGPDGAPTDASGDPSGERGAPIAAFVGPAPIAETEETATRLPRSASSIALGLVPVVLIAVGLGLMPGSAASVGVAHEPAAWVVSEPSEPPRGDDLGALAAQSTDGAVPSAPVLPVPSAAITIASALPTSTAAATKAVNVVYAGSSHARVVALTFDDGYSPANTKAIFDILQREKVSATFFANGYVFSRGPAVWKAIAAAGLPVANHTYSHVDVRRLTDDAIRKELDGTAAAFEKITGVPMARLFRPPFGAHDARTDAAVGAAGYSTIVLWNTTDADTSEGVTAQAATASALKGDNGAIILLHAGPDITPKILPGIIAAYRARGFGFVTIPELLEL